jgi:hypothetical protein
MPTTTASPASPTQAAEISALLERASKLAGEAMTSMADVVTLCTEEADGENVHVDTARALLGHAYVSRKWVEWALVESDEAIKELTQQVFFAEEHLDAS